MGRALEKRIRKLEQAIGGLPCDKPGHTGLYIFIDEDGKSSAENEARMAEIRACEKCRDKTVIHIVQWSKKTWDEYKDLCQRNPVPPERMVEFGRAIGGKSPEQRDGDGRITFNFGVDPDLSRVSDPEPFQCEIRPADWKPENWKPREAEPVFELPDWLKDLEEVE